MVVVAVRMTGLLPTLALVGRMEAVHALLLVVRVLLPGREEGWEGSAPAAERNNRRFAAGSMRPAGRRPAGGVGEDWRWAGVEGGGDFRVGSRLKYRAAPTLMSVSCWCLLRTAAPLPLWATVSMANIGLSFK